MHVGLVNLSTAQGNGWQHSLTTAPMRGSAEPAGSETTWNGSETPAPTGFIALLVQYTLQAIYEKVPESKFHENAKRLKEVEGKMRCKTVRERTTKVLRRGPFAGLATFGAVVPGLRANGFNVLIAEGMLCAEVCPVGRCYQSAVCGIGPPVARWDVNTWLMVGLDTNPNMSLLVAVAPCGPSSALVAMAYLVPCLLEPTRASRHPLRTS